MEAGGPTPTEKQTIHHRFFLIPLKWRFVDIFFRKKQSNGESKWPHYITYIH